MVKPTISQVRSTPLITVPQGITESTKTTEAKSTEYAFDTPLLDTVRTTLTDSQDTGITVAGGFSAGAAASLKAAIEAAGTSAGVSEAEMLAAINTMYACWATGDDPTKKDISEETLAAIESMLDYASSADSGSVPEETLTAIQGMLDYWNTETANKADLLGMLGISEGDSSAAGALLAFIESLGGGADTLSDLFNTTDDDYLDFLAEVGVNPTGDFSAYSLTEMLQELGIGNDGTSSTAAAALVELFERLGVSEVDLAKALETAGIPEAARSELLARLGISGTELALAGLGIDGAAASGEAPPLADLLSGVESMYAGWSEATSAAGDVDVAIKVAPLTVGSFSDLLESLKDDPTGGAPKQDLVLDPPWEKDRPAGEPGGGREGRIERQERREARREARAERGEVREARRDHRAQLLKGAAHGIRRDRDDCGCRCFGSKNHPAVPPGLLSKVREGKIDQSCHNDITSLFGSKFPLDINAFVQWVLRESYLQSTEDLYYYAEKVQYYNDVKESIRNELADMNEILAGMAGMDESAEIPSGSFSEQEFETNYVPGAESSSAAASDEELAAVAAQQAETERMKELAAQYEEDLTAGGKETEKSYSKKMTINKGDAADIASDWVDEMIEWFESLSPKAQEALMTEWQESGFSVSISAGEQDFGNEQTYTGKESFTKMAEGSTDYAAYFAACGAELADEIKAMGNTDDEEAGDPEWENVQISTGKMTATEVYGAKIDMPQELQDIGYESGMDVEDLLEGGDGSSNVVSTKAELEAYIAELEEQVSTVGDDAQLANVDLQNMLQKQQQTLQMLSNISKTLYDTAMSIVRNMGG